MQGYNRFTQSCGDSFKIVTKETTIPEKETKPGAYHSCTDRPSDRHDSQSALDCGRTFATTKLSLQFISAHSDSLNSNKKR